MTTTAPAKASLAGRIASDPLIAVHHHEAAVHGPIEVALRAPEVARDHDVDSLRCITVPPGSPVGPRTRNRDSTGSGGSSQNYSGMEVHQAAAWWGMRYEPGKVDAWSAVPDE